MHPTIFGFIDSYILLMIVGIIFAFANLIIFFKRNNCTKLEIIDSLICSIFAIIIGIIFAILFENLYEFIDNPSNYHWTWGMTFLGGLIGGVLGFLLLFFLWFRKIHPGVIKLILCIAPSSITLAQAFGRIGCFLAGCCYGKETNSAIGVKFPGLENKVIPTQLIESGCLFVISALLIFIAYYKKMREYGFSAYLFAYGVTRFIIEFFRGDYRGAYFLGALSPSQVISIIMIILSPVYIIVTRKLISKYEKQNI